MYYTDSVIIDDIHLFETSILGEARHWRIAKQDIVIVPCYHLVLESVDKMTSTFEHSYLLFIKAYSYSYDMKFYGAGGKEFSGETARASTIFQAGTSPKSSIVSNMGYFMERVGWLSYQFSYKELALIYYQRAEGMESIDLEQCINNENIIRFLSFCSGNKLYEFMKNHIF